jgi:hypothetical protein
MSLFSKLQDVYFDAVKLRQELEQIPPECDCRNADAHLSGTCSCAGATTRRAGLGTGSGCVVYLEELNKDIDWLREDMRRERGQLLPGEASGELEGRLILIGNLIDSLGRTLDRIGADLTEFRASCAYPDLERLKGRSSELGRYTSELNRIL